AMVSSQSVAAQQNILSDGIRQAAWFASPYRQPPLMQTPSLNPQKGARGPLLIPNETLKRAYIFQSWRAPALHDPDYPAFCLLLQMLKGFSSGFFKVLRTEKGLVYGVHQDYTQRKEGGSYEVMAREVDFKRIHDALEGMHDVTLEMIQKPVSA